MIINDPDTGLNYLPLPAVASSDPILHNQEAVLRFDQWFDRLIADRRSGCAPFIKISISKMSILFTAGSNAPFKILINDEGDKITGISPLLVNDCSRFSYGELLQKWFEFWPWTETKMLDGHIILKSVKPELSIIIQVPLHLRVGLTKKN